MRRATLGDLKNPVSMMLDLPSDDEFSTQGCTHHGQQERSSSSSSGRFKKNGS